MATKTKAVDLPPDIEDLEDYTETINILCHSDTGGGKTVMWSRLPNVLILALEEGTVSAKRWERSHPRPRSAGIIKVWKCPTLDAFVEAFEWCRDAIEDGTFPFEWVLIDSVTAAQVRILRAIMADVVKANKKRDPDIPAIQDHFKWQLMLKRMVTDWNELPVNVVWLARSMNKEDPDGEDIVVPLIEGKDYQISAWVCGEMHLVCYLKKAKKGKGENASMVRKLYTNEHPMYWCKDRYDVLPHVITNPDANKIVKTIIDSGATPQMATTPAVTSKSTTTKKTTASKKGAGTRARTKRRAATK